MELTQKRSAGMKTASAWNVRDIMGKFMAGLVFTAMTGMIGVLPAHSSENDKRNEKHDNGRYEQRGRGYDRDQHNHGRYKQDRRYRPPVYRERVYVAPPVIYAPPRPPGISIFLPPLIF
jgi:hypothetical protein